VVIAGGGPTGLMLARPGEPLKMDRTTFVSAALAVPQAAGREVTEAGVVRVGPWTPRSLAPAGTTLLSTVTDIARLARAHLDDPRVAELRRSTEEVRIHGRLDASCLGLARFDWDGGPVWGWDASSAGSARSFGSFRNGPARPSS